MIILLLADDQMLVRSVFAVLLELEEDFSVVAQVGCGDDVVVVAAVARLDVVLFDIEMSGIDGLAAVAAFIYEVPSCCVIMLTTFGRPGYLRWVMEVGALGFVVKDVLVEQLADVVCRVAQGERVVDFALAAATLAGGAFLFIGCERDVFVVVCDGATVVDIARKLFFFEGMVRNYLSAAIAKMGVCNRVEAVWVADERGWL